MLGELVHKRGYQHERNWENQDMNIQHPAKNGRSGPVEVRLS